MTNKIGWCDMTWNPVWGCRNHCEYCYARAIAKRFGGVKADQEYFSHYWGNKRTFKETLKSIDYLNELSNKLINFELTFLEGAYYKNFPKKPQRIFVGSMSEIAHWEKEWIERVIEKTKQYPQHTFQFLTQDPDIYFGKYKFPMNCWLGTTIVGMPYKNRMMRYTTEKAFNINKNNLKYISFEPLLERVELNFKVDWVIIGAETGNRKGKVIPKLDWVLEIVKYCENNKIPVYIKDNLSKYYGECRGYKGFPK